MNLNILHMIFSMERGGAETYLYNMLDNPEEDISIHVICNHRGSAHDRLEERTGDIETVRMRHILDIGAARRIATYCKEKDIDIIQAHFLRENYIAVLSKLFNPRIRIIWTAHLIQQNNWIIRFLNRIFSSFIDRIICVSKAVEASIIEEGISEDITQVIYNGVDTKYFKYIENGIREELSVPSDTLLLTTIARFHKEKGHSFLMDALKELKEYIPNFRALLLGEGKERDTIEDMMEEYGLDEQIMILGYTGDIIRILSATDIYLSPSKMEAISFSILEALSCGVPVVATHVGGVPEIFEKGNCGILVPFGDEKVFAKAIVELYNSRSEYRHMRENCRNIVEEHFSQENMLKDTYGLYRELGS